MKHKNSIITSCVVLALAGSAHAGVWSTINWTDDTSLSFITSSNVTHSADFVGPAKSAATINGHTFETISFVDSPGTFTTPYSGLNFTIGSSASMLTYDLSAGVSDTASSNLSDGLIAFQNLAGAGQSVTYNLTGLSTNTNYEFYFFNPDWTGGATRTGFLDGSDDGVGNTFAIDQTPGAGDKIIKYAYNTGASTTFTMTATSNNAAGLHNFAFVNVIAPPADPFANWMATNYPAILSPNNQPGADPDNDGIANLMEYVLQGGNPSVSTTGTLPTLDASGANFVLTYYRRAAATGTTQTFEYSTILGAGSWTPVAIPGGAGVVVTPDTPGTGIDEVKITVAKGAETKLFGRLQVVK